MDYVNSFSLSKFDASPTKKKLVDEEFFRYLVGTKTYVKKVSDIGKNNKFSTFLRGVLPHFFILAHFFWQIYVPRTYLGRRNTAAIKAFYR